MTPTSVRMVLVEGEKADGLTVDHDVFSVGGDETSATAAQQVVSAILGTRESAAEGGHRLVATGVAWRDHDEAAALRQALAAHHLDNVMLVSELHAAGALAQAAGRAVGHDRTALMFLERDTATVSVVETSDGSIVKVETHDLHTEDATAELAAMVAGLERLDAPPQGVFVIGSGVSVAAIKLQLESATSLPVIAPDEAELALARGAALAGANAPQFEATTVHLAFDPSAADTQMAGIGYMASASPLAYSEVIDEPDLAPLAEAEPEPEPEHKPFLLVGSAVTSIFVIGVAALVISLAVSIRPTVDERPTPGENMIVPPKPPAAAVSPKAPAPEPPMPETIPAPRPVVQEAPQPQAPRTVFVEAPAPAPAPAAPAPAPAPPPAAPAPAPAPAPAAPPPVVVPAPIIPPPVIVLPRPKLPPVFRPPWDPPKRDNDNWDPPKQQWPQWPSRPPQTPKPQVPQIPTPQVPVPQVPQVPTPQVPAPQVPQVPQVPQTPKVPESPKVPDYSSPPSYSPPSSQWPGQSSGGSDRGSSGSGSGSRSGSGSDGSIWPWPSFGN